jgi:hypothetical protein
MNRLMRTLLFIMVMWQGFTACRKDSDVFIPDIPNSQGPDTTWFNAIAAGSPVNVLKDMLRPVASTDSFEVNNNPVTIVAANGLTCTFPPQCCTRPNGQPVTGLVSLQTLLIRKRGDMVAADKPTVSNNRLLVSGGEMFVRLTKNGEELRLAPGKVITLQYNEPQPVNNMRVFYGDESNPDRFNWLPADSGGITQPVLIGPANNNYIVNSTKLRWINCDYFFDTTGINRIQVTASLAPQFTNANTMVYLVFNNLRSVLGMYGTVATKKFQSGLVPVGQPVTMVVISKQGNDYFLGRESFITGQYIVAQQQPVGVAPQPSSLQDIQTYLSTL